MSAPPPLTPEDIALAGEYVLGALPLAERQAAAARVASEPAFAREVARWVRDLDPLGEEVAAVAPPARVWAGLETRLFGAGEPAGYGLWRWLAGASGLSVALMGALLWLGEPVLPARGQLWVSDMVSADGAVRLAALFDAKTGEMRVSMGGASPAPGHDFELWVIADSAAPVSLGVMPRQGKAAMPIPAELRGRLITAVLAITDEPQGGAPGGVATGPLVAKAALRQI
jgi:anti-sigma-K factor RskA